MIHINLLGVKQSQYAQNQEISQLSNTILHGIINIIKTFRPNDVIFRIYLPDCVNSSDATWSQLIQIFKKWTTKLRMVFFLLFNDVGIADKIKWFDTRFFSTYNI